MDEKTRTVRVQTVWSQRWFNHINFPPFSVQSSKYNMTNSSATVPIFPYTSSLVYACTWIYSNTRALFCYSRSQLRKLFPSWHKWILTTLGLLTRAELCIVSSQSLLHQTPDCLPRLQKWHMFLHVGMSWMIMTIFSDVIWASKTHFVLPYFFFNFW